MFATPQEDTRSTSRVPVREIAVRCLYFGGLAVFVVMLWAGVISLVQAVRLIVQAGLP
jgi:hypothetical protein